MNQDILDWAEILKESQKEVGKKNDAEKPLPSLIPWPQVHACVISKVTNWLWADLETLHAKWLVWNAGGEVSLEELFQISCAHLAEEREEVLFPDVYMCGKILNILEYGRKTYGAFNWQNLENGFTRFCEAANRHMIAYLSGEGADKDTGESHLAHFCTNILFMLWFKANKP